VAVVDSAIEVDDAAGEPSIKTSATRPTTTSREYIAINFRHIYLVSESDHQQSPASDTASLGDVYPAHIRVNL
jgi:hypothetical protein